MPFKKNDKGDLVINEQGLLTYVDEHGSEKPYDVDAQVKQMAEYAKSASKRAEELDTQLANFARRCANGEKKCFELAYKWLNNGKAPEPDAILTPYNEDYGLGAMEKLDREYLLQMLRANAISQETYLQLLQKLNVLGKDFDIEAALASSSREIKDSEGPSGVAKAGQSLLELAGRVTP